MTSPREFLNELFETAVAAAHPSTFLPRHLPAPPAKGRLILFASGKAGGSMAEVAERFYLDDAKIDPKRLDGIAVTRHGYGRPTRQIPMIEAGHPVPDQAGIDATERTLQLADTATADDLVLVLMSGGASANWIAPAAGITLAEKQALTRALLRSGANIGEINTLRKHLSRIKGGRLAARAAPARVLTLAVSDVPGDDPDVIGSGPTVPDTKTLADALAVVKKFNVTLPPSIANALKDPANESPKPGDAIFANTEYRLVAKPMDAFDAVQAKIRAAGYEPVFLGDRLEGEARDTAAEHMRLAKELQAAGKRAVLLSGGELTVTIRGQGKGGPNQEYALAATALLAGTKGIAVLAGDTDGTDGGGGDADSPAGAYADGETAAKAASLGLDPAQFLAENDSTGFFARTGGLLTPGPTYTNVNDFRAILVNPCESV
ncbi:glycerate kinase type-2 family protein [Variibacter gotjawalensis]|uniref:glycerate kinase type-2 family protein n=1 Tax=Variibacter gotjawalensis TaxID=1333996 RepID=UPI000BBA91CE|nr:glycerate kinase [Variibacter gotjawalensis]NIK48047.1 hydroxypyruvate reductase [Variibacter gotjawalensis]RZS49924.1 glycerate 2-kinase [Variibacter gotjawalensis]